jgi:hypothetical protein
VVRVPPTAGWISQSIRVAAMRIPWMSFLAACCCRGSNVQPTVRKRKGLAAKQTRFAREEWMLGGAGTETAAPRPHS